MTATSQSIQIVDPVIYKGYTIEIDPLPYLIDKFMFYPTEQGIDHDYDSDGVDFLYVGNCKWANSIDDAKDQINDKIAESMPYYTVEMNGRNYPWEWLSDAVGFASKFNGTMNVSFNSI